MNCPYCSKPFESTPKRGGKCPHCAETFYVRGGEAYTWAGAKEYDKVKNRKYPHEVRFCPNCGDMTEAGDFYFKRINPCTTCRHYIDWPNNKVIQWDDVDRYAEWFNPRFQAPGISKYVAGSPLIEISEDGVGYHQPLIEDIENANKKDEGEEWKRGTEYEED